LENVNRIKEYQTTHPDATFTMGINHLTDQRIEVGKNIFLKYKKKNINYISGIRIWFKIIC